MKHGHFSFFVDDISRPDVAIDPAELRHATAVLRMHNGDLLHLIDGKGWSAEGALCIAGNGKTGTVTITKRTFSEPLPLQCTLAVGLPDRDAFETILGEVTPLGIARIVPISMRYCQKRWWEASWEKQLHRFRQIMITALKQSQGRYLPELVAPCSLQEIITLYHTAGFVADPDGKPLHTILCPQVTNTPVIGYVGPPGGFSDDETALFKQYNVQPVQIAHQRLRTELAATTLCAQIIGYSL